MVKRFRSCSLDVMNCQTDHIKADEIFEAITAVRVKITEFRDETTCNVEETDRMLAWQNLTPSVSDQNLPGCGVVDTDRV